MCIFLKLSIFLTESDFPEKLDLFKKILIFVCIK